MPAFLSKLLGCQFGRFFCRNLPFLRGVIIQPMKRRASLIRWAAIGLLIMAAFLLTTELVRYGRIRSTFPTGLRVAGIPVGGLSYTAASDRLIQAYLSPIELHYAGAPIQVRPAILGFELRLDNMLAVADQQRTAESFWVGFWKYLWNQPISSRDIELQARYDDERILSFLENEVAPRYDLPSASPMPLKGEGTFNPGAAGSAIDYPVTLERVKESLASSDKRVVNIALTGTQSTRPTLAMLDFVLRDVIDNSPFDGIVELYMKDLRTGMVIHFTHSKVQGEDPLPVDISFSSWSTIKMPVLVSAFARLQPPYNQETLTELEKMVELSDNDSTDRVAASVVDRNFGPLRVTEDMQELGLVNTFWGGFFKLGSPLLQRYSTPANSRSDINTRPDPYSQTTPRDLGLLLEEIYRCAKTGGGSLPLAFYGAIDQNDCGLMLQYLEKNKLGSLIQAGIPAEGIVAHKHGWANEAHDGLIHTIGDSAIVMSPGGDFILSIFVYHPVQAIFDNANILFARLAAAAYSYFNLK